GLDHTRDGEVTRDKIYGEGLETNTVKSASEIIQSAAYACIQINSDEPPATQGGLDHTRDGELTRDKIYSEGLETNTTKLTASDDQVFTGMYNVVAPLTPPVRSASEIIELAAYACIQVNSDKTTATQGDGKQKAQPQRQSSAQGTETVHADLGDATEGETAEHPRMYTDIKVREVPAVPMKSSVYRISRTTVALDISIYSESINPSDFTRNRMKGGGNDPQYLGPIYTVASSLPEIYQDPAEVTSENITEKTKLGDGQFGEVVLANTNGLSLKSMGLSKTDNNPNISVTVAAKKLQSNPSQTQREAFEKEAQFMSHIKHPNVLRLLGVCIHDSAFIMMEYTEGGDLNQFLQSYSEIVTTSSSQTQITSSELVYIASQIASGMQYLASLKFVHRDLATRNCFITTNNFIKVGDVGVNTSLYQSSYYRIRGNRMMPIRWMATECFSGKFSEKSDVWAFGVTMWEMFTLAKQLPYRHLSDEEVIHNSLKREYRQFPVKPVACPQPVYDVMEKCWAVDMRHRLTFQKLIDWLKI
ncbi:Class II receptor tyrosine kinase, partial [Geodia barretti]